MKALSEKNASQAEKLESTQNNYNLLEGQKNSLFQEVVLAK